MDEVAPKEIISNYEPGSLLVEYEVRSILKMLALSVVQRYY